MQRMSGYPPTITREYVTSSRGFSQNTYARKLPRNEIRPEKEAVRIGRGENHRMLIRYDNGSRIPSLTMPGE